MSDAEKLARLKELIEVLDSVDFVRTEQGLGQDEVDMWTGKTWSEIRNILGSRMTCCMCGDMYVGEHECGDPVDSSRNLSVEEQEQGLPF